MQQKSHVRFVFGQLFFKDIPENKNGLDNALTSNAQAGSDLEISVDISTPIL